MTSVKLWTIQNVFDKPLHTFVWHVSWPLLTVCHIIQFVLDHIQFQLQENKHLITVFISGNLFQDKDCPLFATAILVSYIKVYSIQQSQLLIIVLIWLWCRPFGKLSLFFQENRFIRELDLSHNQFGEGAGALLGHAIGEQIRIEIW